MTTTTDPDPQAVGDREPFAAGNSADFDGLNLNGRRRWPAALVGLALGVAATVTVSTLLDRDGDDTSEVDAVTAELATAEVRVDDLIEEVEWLGDLRYGDPVEVAAVTDATVTRSTPAGKLLERGDVIFELDNQPVVLWYGHLPLWRDLAQGAEGPDVELLETNLVALGYDPDGTVTIDGVFTANTALMVERWQADVGREITGQVGLGDVVLAPGPASVTDAATIGERLRAAAPIASLSVRHVTTTIVGGASGTIHEVATTGTAVGHGTVLYETGEVAVQALLTLDPVGERLVDPETDPTELEALLVSLGYDPDREMQVDSAYDDATVAAVQRWQADVGLVPTGSLDASAYIVLPEGLEVHEQLVQPGAETLAPHPILVLATPTLQVVVPVGLAEHDDFSVGQQLSVVLADETTAPGVVVDVGTVASAAEPGADPLVDVIIELTGDIDDAVPASEVSVVVAGDSVIDVMVVPTRALVTLAEGGFAVEKVLQDGTIVLVGVETGTFDDGVVEVESSQLQPGDQIAVPQ